MGVPANDDGLDPAGNQSGDVAADDGFPEDGSTQYVPNGPVGRAPHLLQFELIHPLFIWRDGGTLDAHAVAPHRLSCLHRHAVVRSVTVLHSEVITGQVTRETFLVT